MAIETVICTKTRRPLETDVRVARMRTLTAEVAYMASAEACAWTDRYQPGITWTQTRPSQRQKKRRRRSVPHGCPSNFDFRLFSQSTRISTLFSIS
jgi:hypothetical protein